MSKNRLIAIFAVLVLLVAAAFTIEAGTAISTVVPNPDAVSPITGAAALDRAIDYTRMTGTYLPITGGEASDRTIDYSRMTGTYLPMQGFSLMPGNAVDLSDYYQRHLGASIALNTAGGADWFQRHPESLNPGNAVDLTDYYARHPGASIALNMAGGADWFQRHPESLNAGNAVDLSDYYARHPEKE